MNKKEIEKYLRMVGQELQKDGHTFEIILLGGAVMLIEVGNRDSTEDVDTYFLPDFIAISKAATVVAEREGLPIGWLDSTAAGFTHTSLGPPAKKLWKKFPGLAVYTAPLDYLFVAKLLSHRPRDEADIIALAKKLRVSRRKTALAYVEKYIPRQSIPEDVLDEIEERFER